MLNHSLALEGTQVTGGSLTVPHLLLTQSPGVRLDAPSSPNTVLFSLLGHCFRIIFLPLLMSAFHKLLSMVPGSLEMLDYAPSLLPYYV